MSTLKQAIATSLAGLMLAGGGYQLATQMHDANITNTVTTGCVIRFTEAGNGWPVIYENSAHVNTGCESVRFHEDGMLQVEQKIKAPVVTLTATPDECLTARGMEFGPSSGTGTTYYQAAHNGVPVELRSGDNRELVRGNGCNLWVGFTQIPNY